mmetsp:Transcript_150368/g.483245  ORF Transcript_150368/g.483245 Transcript_150368/m.483245 type:complete len:349 (-) Transcript_150368:33-1079(-)
MSTPASPEHPDDLRPPHPDRARELFGPQPPGDAEKLRRAYLRLAMRYHPDKWPDRNRQAATRLFQAIGAMYEELQRPFGRQISKRVRSPVAAAAELGDLAELRQLLVDLGSAAACVADENGTYPLMFAARGGSLEAVQLLISHGADMHARTPLDWSVLLFAALSDHAELVRWLAARGAPVTAREIILAVYTGSLHGFKALVDLFGESAADLRTTHDSNSGGPGKSLLHLACEGMCHLRRDRAEAYVPCMEHLLQLGVPIHVVEPVRGRTCLHSFVGNAEWVEHRLEDSAPYLAALRLLCRWGASPTREDSDGLSALALAASMGLGKVGEVLRSFEGPPPGPQPGASRL